MYSRATQQCKEPVHFHKILKNGLTLVTLAFPQLAQLTFSKVGGEREQGNRRCWEHVLVKCIQSSKNIKADSCKRFRSTRKQENTKSALKTIIIYYLAKFSIFTWSFKMPRTKSLKRILILLDHVTENRAASQRISNVGRTTQMGPRTGLFSHSLWSWGL